MYTETYNPCTMARIKHCIDPFAIVAVVFVHKYVPTVGQTYEMNLFMDGGTVIRGEYMRTLDKIPVGETSVPSMLFSERPEFEWIHYISTDDTEYLIGCTHGTVGVVTECMQNGNYCLRVNFYGSGTWEVEFSPTDDGRRDTETFKNLIIGTLANASLSE